jgi:peptidoglycan hydrolase CwlO-like protein
MSRQTPEDDVMKKQSIAMLAALVMTACMGVAILSVGGVALFNKKGTTVANSQAQAVQVNAGASQQAQIQQLQDLVSQYQARENEYQTREQQYKQQLDQVNAQVQGSQQQLQQVQALLAALQQRGLITITSDGQIFINR